MSLMSLMARFVRTIPWLVLIVLAAPRLADAELVWAIDTTFSNKLVVVASENPGVPLLEKFVGGMGGEKLLAIDFRPLDGQLYGYGSDHRLYRIHPWTAWATPISTAPLAITVAPGAGVGFDFNPVTDEIRVISDTGQNFRVNPSTGEVIDGNPAPGIQADSPLIPSGDYVAAAYTNNYQGAADTTLVALNGADDTFVRIGGQGGNPSPDLGSVTTIGPLGQLVLYPRAGLDVSRENHVYANFGSTNLFVINRTTGNATQIGAIGGVDNVTDIAVLNVSPTMYLLTDENRLLRIKSHTPSTTLTDVLITGMASANDGERILAIDVRPANGRLYGLSNFARLYTIDPLTGVAARVGGPTATITGLIGFSFGIDFDPLLDQLRIVSDLQSNIRVHPDTMAVTQHTQLEDTNVGAIAYSNYAPNSASTELFGVNSTSDDLVRIGGVGGTPSADTGTISVIRDVDANVPPPAGLDMSPVDDALYLAARINGGDSLYVISRGIADRIGTILNAGSPVIGLAVAAPGFVELSTAAATVNEQAGTVTLMVSRVGPPEGPLSVEYETSNSVSNAASHGVDYTNTEGTLVFLDGETSKSIVVPITNDTLAESDENFQVLLTSPTLGARLGTTVSTLITIVDNDTTPGNAPPTITITQPTPAPTFTAQGSVITLGGTAADDAGIATIAWSNDRSGSGTAQGTTSWLAPDIPLALGTNIITMTVTDAGGLQSTDTLTVTLSTLTYVLAEGATGPFFDLDILLANPNATPAPVTVTFLKEGGSTVVQTLTLPATSRTTLRADTIAGIESAAVSTVVTSDAGLPLIVERTMQWDASGYGAHTEKAAETPAPKWYFAEGSQGFFYTYLLLVNPGTVGVDVVVQYLREGTSPLTRVYTVPAQSRFTVDAGADPELVNYSFGMTVEFQGLGVAERAMYFGLDPLWKAGHESAGVTTPATEWLLAEGATGSFFDTFLLLSNPGTTPADVTVTYLLASGATIERKKTVAAQGRHTINVEFEDAALASAAFGTTVESTVPIVVERAQYWPATADQWYEAHNSFGVLSTGTKWGIAEGRAGGPDNYQTYILLANPGGTTADVTITFLRTSGAPVVKTFEVAPFSRFNVAVGAGGQVPELANEDFGAVISSTQPIVVERAMYADAGGLLWSAGTNATATRLP